jgi:hypothetical protein
MLSDQRLACRTIPFDMLELRVCSLQAGMARLASYVQNPALIAPYLRSTGKSLLKILALTKVIARAGPLNDHSRQHRGQR